MNARAAAAPTAVPDTAVEAVRRFNRFYTRRAGVLAPYLGGELSLTEVRVLYELAQRDGWVASELARALGLDAGYLSRILKGFERSGWLSRAPSPVDARQSLLTLTRAGHKAFAPLQRKSREEAAAMLAPLAVADRRAVVDAMARIEGLLDPAAPPATRTVVLREPVPGDLGWVVSRHGEVYAREYGWNMDFEALVAEVVATFRKRFRPGLERGWIAELDGERVGSAFVVRKSATVAQLRLVLLVPAARGLGLGGRLTDEAIAFARERGYRKMVLWTHECLTAARAIYASRGFVMDASQAYEAFGHPLVSENWSLRLR